MSVAALADRIRAGELSARAAVEESLRRIAEIDPELNSLISVRADEALAEADALDSGPPRRPLHGVPIAVKDVIDVAGARTTAAPASWPRTSLDRRRDRRGTACAGAVVVGKLNTHEFAFGAMTTSPYFGPARNPWATDRICGGSSGGSGAAAAARLVPATLGTDTAGSIRIPASSVASRASVRPPAGSPTGASCRSPSLSTPSAR